jgi:hypothetical protein
MSELTLSPSQESMNSAAEDIDPGREPHEKAHYYYQTDKYIYMVQFLFLDRVINFTISNRLTLNIVLKFLVVCPHSIE